MAKRYVDVGYVGKTKDGKNKIVIEGVYNREMKKRIPITIGGPGKEDSVTLFVNNMEDDIDRAREYGATPERIKQMEEMLEKTPDWKRKVLRMQIEVPDQN